MVRWVSLKDVSNLNAISNRACSTGRRNDRVSSSSTMLSVVPSDDAITTCVVCVCARQRGTSERDLSLASERARARARALSLSLSASGTRSLVQIVHQHRRASLKTAHLDIYIPHTATHCNTMHHTATYCNTLEHTATYCNTLQHTATHCNTLQHTPEPLSRPHILIYIYHTLQHIYHTLQQSPPHATAKALSLFHTAAHGNTLQHTATHCNRNLASLGLPARMRAPQDQHTATHCSALRHTARHCNRLQQTATHCNTLQHTATHCNRHLASLGLPARMPAHQRSCVGPPSHATDQ